MKLSAAPGVFDIVPIETKEQWRCSHLWNYVENMIRQTVTAYGFQEIRTPIFERTELFHRGVGETSDIVSKEMYTFLDKGERLMSLRPEGTAPAMRAFIEHQLHNLAPVHKLFYIGPMFRYERAQAGRYRQHHQFGAEAIGNAAPEQDVELIDMLFTLYQRLGLQKLQVSINTIGDIDCRLNFRKALQDYLRSYYDSLSPDSQARFETNPLRILDSKDTKDREIIANAPSILNFLNEECLDHFNDVKKLLGNLKIPFEVNPKLVRGLDYYNKTVFEITSGELGAQNSVAGGGRYDGLLKTLGGPDLPAIGFGTGLERVIQTMLKQEVSLPKPFAPTLFIIAMGQKAKEASFSLLHDLRLHGISAEMDFSNKKVNKLMQYANQIEASNVAVIGDNELQKGEIEIKDMLSGTKRTLPLMHAAKILYYEKQNGIFMKNLEELSKPFSQPSEADFFINRLNETINLTTQAVNNLQSALQKMQDILE
ncbi:MAG: histidine--tRNA ligase [Parachlamydiaceae bacterium]|nr:histidine--tRNA ligase [Parachlamydiaceae bacterium]